LAKATLEPLKVFPDSSESYNLTNFMKLLKYYYLAKRTRKIDRRAQKIVRAILQLERLRRYEPATSVQVKNKSLEMRKLAKEILTSRNLAIHERNRLLNLPLISTNKYEPRIKIKHRLPDVILYLLYAIHDKPIHGRIAMMKQVFLLIKEVLGESNVEDAKFVPYRYGPYSFLLTHVLSNLEYDGLIKITGRKNTASEKFSLTDTGKMIAKRKFTKLPKKFRDMTLDRRKGWDEDHIKGLLAYVYNKYPEYAEKSNLKNKYKSISWGRARG